MRFVVTGAGFDSGKTVDAGFGKGGIFDVEILAKKINGYWTRWHNSIAFVCNDDIRVVHMTEEERAMPVYWQPGYPGKE